MDGYSPVMDPNNNATSAGPALMGREQFPSYNPSEGTGLKAHSHNEAFHQSMQDGGSISALSETSSATSPSHPSTPPLHELGSPAPAIVDLSPPASTGTSAATHDIQATGFHPATLAQKLAAHEAHLTRSPSPSASAASSRATAGEMTPRSDSDMPLVKEPWTSSAPRVPSALLSPVAKPAESSGSSAFSSRVSTIGSDVSPQNEPSRAPNGVSEHPADDTRSSAQDTTPKAQAKSSGLASPELKERTASPSKSRPAVFSAIPPKDKDVPVTPRSAVPEKKTMLGKMLDGMRSKEHLAKDKDHAPRPRGRSFVSEPDSGGESDTKSETGRSSFLKLPRKMSGGKKDKEREKDAFLSSEQAKAAALARGDADKRHRSDSRAQLERRPSEKSNDGRKSGKASEGKESMGQSVKDFMERAPLMNRKSSMTSKRSDDGKSDKGSTYGGESDYGDSKKGGNSASLLKKYGACEKVAIGKGATAVVRLAHKWDKSTERLYAVKEFRKRRKNESEKDYVKKLTSEFCISSTLHHPNVVETVDLVQDENHHWCEVMEYCPGGDLYAAIKRGELTQTQTNNYFQQMVSGVAYLHSMGVAHRDIKPENLLLDANDQIKITDFGVSDVFRMCWEKTCHLSKGLCGSEPYIAPEQFEPKAQYDARLVDVWACAIVFYCMQFQELPWRVAKLSDPSFAAFVEAYPSTHSPPPLGDLSPRECRPIIKAMLNPDPKHRATTEVILKDKWFASLLPQSAAGTAVPKVVQPSPALKSAIGR